MRLEELVADERRAPEAAERLAPHLVIRMLRGALHMTQAQLAKRAELPQSHLAKIESGRVDLQLSTLRRIFRAMDCDTVVLPKFRKRTRAALRARLPIRVVDKEDDRDALRYWLSRPPGARIDAVEFLRRQMFVVEGRKAAPRLARSISMRDLHQ